VVSSNKGGNWDLYTVGITGNEGLKPLLQTPYAKFVQAVGPDGSVVYMEQHPVTGTDLWMLTPGGRTLPLVVTQYNEFGASLSADGRFAAYQSDETGRPEVYVVPSSGGGPRVAISTEGGAAPVWSRNGRELFYRSGADLISVDVQTEGTLLAGAHRRILDVSAYDPGEFREFDVAADGQRFLFIRTEPAARPTRLDVVLDGFDEVRAKVGSR
jgi:Tol biopolymer transport system component